MIAQALFAKGGFRVLDRPSTERGHQTIGFGWVEETPQGQLQRWILRSLLGAAKGGASAYVFEPWPGAPEGLAAWTDAVDELWPQEGGFYAVAQSTVVLPLLTQFGVSFSEPHFTYPRHEAVVAHTAAARRPSAPRAILAAPPVAPRAHAAGHPAAVKDLTVKVRPVGQVVIPLFGITQKGIDQPNWSALGDLGFGGGFAAGPGGIVDEPKGQPFFEGDELFLLRSGYVRAGAATGTRWQETPSQEITNLPSLRKLIEESWKEGCRYEATACSYYVGLDAPPEWFR